ncbi:vWA domain-containing protein [Nocardia sp. NBC_01009]|uniref:vWA domain-containing protein n=1 Tax=Nocardia sp. NBC_01009 TaxID=2975996 RepID=UPI00386D7BF3|nr:VWA domain-containing protein [Nocardia sp. NBC_01009]
MSRVTKRLTGLTAAIAIGLTSLSIAALPAHAEEGQEQAPQYAPTMLILDASGSMQRPDPAGTMMDAAKNAVRTFVGSAPAESKVGLTVYGTSTGNAEADKPAGCRDVQVLHKPDTLDKAALTSAVDGIKASGWTPMGTALREAAATLPKSGPRSIVLVSDGDDTCSPPDPCEVARELKQQGLDLVMHAIGFAVDAKARAQLTCMAQATGGTYTDAADGPALERTLPRVTSAALRNYKAAGAPITGTATYDTAPVATPGQYLDTIGQKEKRYWSVEVPAGATAYFSGTVSFPRLPNISSTDDINTLQMHVYGRDGRDCNAFESEMTTSSSDGVALTVAQAFDGATKERKDDTSADKCKGGGRYYFALTWDHVSNGVPERLPIELLVGIEPAATDPGPVAVRPATTFTEPTGARTAATGGGSFNVAAELPASGTYTDTVRPGEFVFYRVRLNWGQGLAYRVRFGATGNHQSENFSNITTTLYSPIRERIDNDTMVYTGSDQVLPSNDPAMATVPIRYNNRNADDHDIRTQAVAGWYYIAVKLGSTSADRGSTPVPIRLDLTVSGAQEGGPKYSTSATDGVFGENTPAGGGKSTGAGAPGAAASAAGATESKSSALIVVAIVGAAGVGVLGAIGGWLFARRRRG